jgi:hypothetical protein
MMFFYLPIESLVMTRQQMADMYLVTRRTFIKWLKDDGFTLKKGLITPKDQERIISILGTPPNQNIIKRMKNP